MLKAKVYLNARPARLVDLPKCMMDLNIPCTPHTRFSNNPFQQRQIPNPFPIPGVWFFFCLIEILKPPLYPSQEGVQPHPRGEGGTLLRAI